MYKKTTTGTSGPASVTNYITIYWSSQVWIMGPDYTQAFGGVFAPSSLVHCPEDVPVGSLQ